MKQTRSTGAPVRPGAPQIGCMFAYYIQVVPKRYLLDRTMYDTVLQGENKNGMRYLPSPSVAVRGGKPETSSAGVLDTSSCCSRSERKANKKIRGAWGEGAMYWIRQRKRCCQHFILNTPLRIARIPLAALNCQYAVYATSTYGMPKPVTSK